MPDRLDVLAGHFAACDRGDLVDQRFGVGLVITKTANSYPSRVGTFISSRSTSKPVGAQRNRKRSSCALPSGPVSTRSGGWSRQSRQARPLRNAVIEAATAKLGVAVVDACFRRSVVIASHRIEPRGGKSDTTLAQAAGTLGARARSARKSRRKRTSPAPLGGEQADGSERHEHFAPGHSGASAAQFPLAVDTRSDARRWHFNRIIGRLRSARRAPSTNVLCNGPVRDRPAKPHCFDRPHPSRPVRNDVGVLRLRSDPLAG